MMSVRDVDWSRGSLPVEYIFGGEISRVVINRFPDIFYFYKWNKWFLSTNESFGALIVIRLTRDVFRNLPRIGNKEERHLKSRGSSQRLKEGKVFRK